MRSNRNGTGSSCSAISLPQHANAQWAMANVIHFFLKTNQKMVTNSDIEVLNVKVGVKKAIILLLQHTKIKVF